MVRRLTDRLDEAHVSLELTATLDYISTRHSEQVESILEEMEKTRGARTTSIYPVSRISLGAITTATNPAETVSLGPELRARTGSRVHAGRMLIENGRSENATSSSVSGKPLPRTKTSLLLRTPIKAGKWVAVIPMIRR